MNPNLNRDTHVIPNAVLAMTSSQGGVNSTWIPDLVLLFMLKVESHNIHQLGHFERPGKIFIGNGQGLHIHGSGSSSLLSPINSNICWKCSRSISIT